MLSYYIHVCVCVYVCTFLKDGGIGHEIPDMLQGHTDGDGGGEQHKRDNDWNDWWQGLRQTNPTGWKEEEGFLEQLMISLLHYA